MSKQFDPLTIPENMQPSAYLTLMVTILANVQALRYQLAEITALLDTNRNVGDVFDYYDNKVKELFAELKVDLYSKFGE
jgi:hypothetical protein